MSVSGYAYGNPQSELKTLSSLRNICFHKKEELLIKFLQDKSLKSVYFL